MGFDALAMGLVGWVPESQYGSNDSLPQIEELGNQVIKCMQISLMDSFAVWVLKRANRRVFFLTGVSSYDAVFNAKI